MKTMFLSAFLYASLGFAATGNLEKDSENPSEATVTTSATGALGIRNIIGTIDFRPSVTVKAAPDKVNSAEYHTETYAELGYRFNSNFSLLYEQDFNTNISNPAADKGFGLVAQAGLFKGKFNNLWADGKGLTFSYEPRLYMPTNPDDRSAGFVTAVRNYLKFSKPISKVVTLTAMEIPIFFVYSKSGVVDPGVKDPTTGVVDPKTIVAKGNPVFENRVYLIADFKLSKNGKWNFSLPVMFHTTVNSEVVGPTGPSKNSNGAQFFLWSWPELAYSVTQNAAVGVAFYTDNLVKPRLEGFDFAGGFNKGVGQVFLRTSL